MSDIIVTFVQGWLVIWFLTPNRMGVVWVAVPHPWLQVPFAFGGRLGECLGECKYPWLMPPADAIGKNVVEDMYERGGRFYPT